MWTLTWRAVNVPAAVVTVPVSTCHRCSANRESRRLQVLRRRAGLDISGILGSRMSSQSNSWARLPPARLRARRWSPPPTPGTASRSRRCRQDHQQDRRDDRHLDELCAALIREPPSESRLSQPYVTTVPAKIGTANARRGALLCFERERGSGRGPTSDPIRHQESARFRKAVLR